MISSSGLRIVARAAEVRAFSVEDLSSRKTGENWGTHFLDFVSNRSPTGQCEVEVPTGCTTTVT
jgi:hypothetical protein